MLCDVLDDPTGLFLYVIEGVDVMASVVLLKWYNYVMLTRLAFYNS